MSDSDPVKLRVFVAHASGMLTDCLPNGDGLVAYGFLKNLAKRGHSIHVAVERSQIEHRLPNNVVLHQVGNLDLPTPRWILMLRIRALYNRLSKTNEFDVIHQLNPVFSGLSLALIGTRPPIVLGTFVPAWPHATVRAFPRNVIDFVARWLKASIAWAQQREASALLLTTPVAKSRIIDQRRNASKMVLLDNGVEINTNADHYAIDSRRILSLCGLSKRKGAEVLLAAFKQVLLRVPDARLIIGGAVDQESAKLVKSELGTSIDFIGTVLRRDLPEFLESGAIFCMPSFGEPYGMAAVEAMSAGLPIICSDSGGLAYLVSQSGGIRVPVNDVSALTNALCRLLNDRELRQEFAEFNKQYALERFAWESVIAKLEGAYINAILHSKIENSRSKSLV